MKPDPIPHVILDREACKGCQLCVSLCPNHLFEPDPLPNDAGYFPIKMHDAQYCINCMRCVEVCPDQAFQAPAQPGRNWSGLLYWLGYRVEKKWGRKS